MGRKGHCRLQEKRKFDEREKGRKKEKEGSV